VAWVVVVEMWKVFFLESVWVKEECLIAFVACAGMGAVGGLLEFSAI
jgi:hypothetical protein